MANKHHFFPSSRLGGVRRSRRRVLSRYCTEDNDGRVVKRASEAELSPLAAAIVVAVVMRHMIVQERESRIPLGKSRSAMA